MAVRLLCVAQSAFCDRDGLRGRLIPDRRSHPTLSSISKSGWRSTVVRGTSRLLVDYSLSNLAV